MIRRFINIFLFLVALLATWWLLSRINILPSISDIFRSKPVRIAETPILVEDIRELAELTTFVSLDEVVVDTIRPSSNPLGALFTNPLAPAQDRLVLLVRGSVKAGTRLDEIGESDIFREKDSVRIALPRAVITDVIVNPSGTETFMESGEWSSDAFAVLVKKAGLKMQYRAISEGIIGKADQRARVVMENFLRQSGFKRVYVSTKY